MINNSPFAKHTPSVFVAYTPFQVLCAVAAIRQLEINDYLFLAKLPRGETRNSQTKALLDKYHIKYEIPFMRTRFSLWYYMCIAFLRHKIHYTRLFIGDLRAASDYYVGYNYVSDGSQVVFLDDGNITINYLQDCISEPMDPNHRARLDRIAKRRNMEVGRNFLTIYGDIESPKNRICQLDLHYVVDEKDNSNCHPKGVYIVGTNLERFCEPLEIPEDVYIEKLGELMQNLRQQYPDDTIYFIPHGREYKDYGQRLCRQNGCVFLRAKMMIELELLNMPYPPKAILGYTSTALHTLKKIFPDTRVVNILFESPKDNPFYKDYVMCSDYYQKNGIEWINEPLP
jgi:hypothetical protein